jgi:hypothetical protein
MSNYSEDQLYNMSDEEIEKLFNDTRLELGDEQPIEEVVEEPEVIDDGQDNLENQESDQNGTEEEATEVAEEDSADSSDDLDGEVTEDGEQTNKATKEADSEVQPVSKSFKYKAAGKEYEFTEKEIMEQFPKIFGQAVDYTKKMQAIKPWRKTIDAIEQAGLSNEDISLAIDILKGDKDAIANVLKRTGIDTLDLDVDNANYVPKSYGRDEATLALKDVVDEISQDQEYQVTHNILSKQWDDTSWRELSSNPDMIRGLHVDVKNGVYQEVSAIASKMKVFDGGKRSDLEYYLAAGREYYNDVLPRRQTQSQQLERNEVKTQKVAEVKKAQEVRKTTAQDAARRKAAAPTKPGPSKPPKVTDYLDPSGDEFEEAFAEWDKQLAAKK